MAAIIRRRRCRPRRRRRRRRVSNCISISTSSAGQLSVVKQTGSRLNQPPADRREQIVALESARDTQIIRVEFVWVSEPEVRTDCRQ